MIRRMTPLKILFLAAEVAPFAKRGGLADVCGSLPKALQGLGHEVFVVMPAYQSVEQAFQTGKWQLKLVPGELRVPTGAGLLRAAVLKGQLPGSEVPIYFIAEKNLFGRSEIYGHDDDAYRFCFFSRASLELISALNWRPDVVHCHDWHTAPALTWLTTTGQIDAFYRGIPTIYTIHNLAHQGRSVRSVLHYLGTGVEPLVEENWQHVNFMARGIYHATMINTVSPTYSREIKTAAGGVKLERLLQYRHFDVHGILNGLDYDVWNPATDMHLAKNFNVETLDTRIQNKRELQKKLGLPVQDHIPMLSIVSRLDHQKGFDIAGGALHAVLNNFPNEVQCVVLGSGAQQYEDMFRSLARTHPNQMTVILQYAAELAPLIYAGSDIFLMPSRFEPCGLGQMIAMRYGCVPVVRATGGLADTVQDGVTGFTFDDFSVEDFWNALRRALYIYFNDSESWRAIQTHGMNIDFSWKHSAYGYCQLYEWAIARVRGY
ncbi:glycogen synthase [bacterium]|nr:glycogen synthase [bacterium]